MLKTKQEISDFLKEKNISPTAQRVEMLHKLLTKNQHLSPEVIYQMVNDDFPKVSRATVYNNLNLFIDNGIVKKLSLGSMTTLFDTNNEAHFHLHEENSEELMDIKTGNDTTGKLESAANELIKKHKGSGFKIKDIIINFEKN
ncbi:MAG: transcriptional repressor [Spirochaetia bacterium]|nr:transcriptional repressor [Spirochaetia bacterium]